MKNLNHRCYSYSEPPDTIPHLKVVGDQFEPPAPKPAPCPVGPLEELERTLSIEKLPLHKVDHFATIGLDHGEIDRLRAPVIVENFMRQGELMLVAAESKSRKSWLAQDLAFSIGDGSPWLPNEDREGGFFTRRAKVWILDLELPHSECAFRFAKTRNTRFPSVAAQRAITERIVTYSLNSANKDEILGALDELKPQLAPGDVVIVDCLYRLEPDGNETLLIAQVMETLKKFAAETMTGILLVDHFRKAGDDKARNRIAGSFVKAASASTILAIEVAKDGTLSMSVDARTFHGCPSVSAKFDLDAMRFFSFEREAALPKDAAAKAELEATARLLWPPGNHTAKVTVSDASDRWGCSRQTAEGRLRRLMAVGWAGKLIDGRPAKFALTPEGIVTLASEPCTQNQQ